MTDAQIAQHRDAFEAAERAMDAVLASNAAGMHQDSLLFWNCQRASFQVAALQLSAILTAHAKRVEPVQTSAVRARPQTPRSITMHTSIDTNNPRLAAIRRRIEGKTGFEILAIHDEFKREQREPMWVAYLSGVLTEMSVDHDGYKAINQGE
jgi:hypothetical protein